MNGPGWGYQAPTDQAVRRQQFERDHPDWTIWYEGDRQRWHARHAVTCEEIHDIDELGALLDELEKRVTA